MLANRRLLILDSVAAARASLSNKTLDREDEILSTHYSVVGFLSARLIECRDFSDFIGIDQTRKAIQDASRDLDEILEGLDRVLGARMCSAAGLPQMAIFHPLFKYLGQYNLAGLRAFERVLAARLSQGGISSVHYGHALSTSIDPAFSFVDAAAQVCRAYGVTYRSTAHPASSTSFISKFNTLARLAKRAVTSPETIARAFLRWSNRTLSVPISISRKNPVAFVLDSAETSFFATALSRRGMQVISVPRTGIAWVRGVSLHQARTMLEKMRSAAIEWQGSAQSVPGSAGDLDRRIVSYVVENAPALLLPLLYAQLIIRAHPVRLAAWEVPLVTRPPLNLLAELFLANGLPVLGRQHGANYVHQDLGTIHFDSDFDRCTHFFSYGFGKKEFETTYPSAQPRCSFVSAGNPPLAVKPSARQVDIAFPIMGCIPLFYLARLPESELVRRQSQILRAIESRKDLSCVVKPEMNYREDTFAHTEALRKLQNARIARTSWSRYLEAWRPRLVVFEIASTPLFEALSLDVDIFLMLDPVFPFNDSALAMLKKRVHVFSTAEEISEAIRQYGVQRLERLRDDEFYRTYVNRGSPDAAFDVIAASAMPKGRTVRVERGSQ